MKPTVPVNGEMTSDLVSDVMQFVCEWVLWVCLSNWLRDAIGAGQG